MSAAIPIRSSDPRKPAIVEALKFKSACSRVTDVQEHRNMPKLKSPDGTRHLDQFSGECLKAIGNGKFEKKGRFYVWATEVRFPEEVPHG